MNIPKQIQKIAKDLKATQPLKKQPDYGSGNDIMHQLAEHAGIDLDMERISMEFPTQEAYKKYLKEHPLADKNLHSVKEKSHEEKTPEAKINIECVGYHSGQKDLVMRLKTGDKNIGSIQYSEYGGTPKIQMIKISPDHRRRGFALALLKQLQKEYPNEEIDFGMLTEDGSKLFDKLDFTELKTEFYPKFNELEQKKQQLKKIDDEIKDNESIELWEKHNDLDNEIFALEEELRWEKPIKRILKT